MTLILFLRDIDFLAVRFRISLVTFKITVLNFRTNHIIRFLVCSTARLRHVFQDLKSIRQFPVLLQASFSFYMISKYSNALYNGRMQDFVIIFSMLSNVPFIGFEIRKTFHFENFQQFYHFLESERNLTFLHSSRFFQKFFSSLTNVSQFEI